MTQPDAPPRHFPPPALWRTHWKVVRPQTKSSKRGIAPVPKVRVVGMVRGEEGLRSADSLGGSALSLGMGQPLPGSSSPRSCFREWAQWSWGARVGLPDLGRAALTQIGPILQRFLPMGCHIPVSLAMGPSSPSSRKTSRTGSFLIVTLTPIAPESTGGRYSKKNVSHFQEPPGC